MLFSELSAFIDMNDSVSNEREKIQKCAEFLKKVSEKELETAVRLLDGKPFPWYYPKAGIKKEWFIADVHIGVQKHLEEKERVTIGKIHDMLESVIKSPVKTKKMLVRSLFLNMQESESRNLSRILLQSRIISSKILVSAVASAFNAEREKVARAYEISEDMGSTAVKAMKKTLSGNGMEIFRPIRTETPGRKLEIEKMKYYDFPNTVFEHSPRGIKIQVHYDKKTGAVLFFEKTKGDITKKFSGLSKAFRESCVVSRVIAEAVISSLKKDISEKDMWKKTTPKILYLTDIFAVDNKSLAEENILRRYEFLKNSFAKKPEIFIAEKKKLNSRDELEVFFSTFDRALVARRLNSRYEFGKSPEDYVEIV